MDDMVQKADRELRKITECPICLSAFNDPRMLPCIHTFCFQCLNAIAEGAQMKPGDKMPCPLCRKEFPISDDGVNGVQKNFFMQNLIECQTMLQMGNVAITCDICSASDEGQTGKIATATMRCLECQDNYCESCLKVHKFQKLSRNHQVETIRSDTESGTKRSLTMKHCTKHTQKPLDYYCADCKKIVCVSCFVESHKSHDCKDVTTIDEEFRRAIEKNAWKMSNYAFEMLSMKNRMEKKKADFLNDIVVKENEIQKRNLELKTMIDEHTKSLLDDLCVAKSNHLKEMENEMEEIDRCQTILRSFEAYCTELLSKGSVSDICSSFDQLNHRADELERDHEAFIGRPHQSLEISIEAIDLKEPLQKFNNNIVGQIKETTRRFENKAIVIGFDGRSNRTEVVKINLHRPNETSADEWATNAMALDTYTAVGCNTMYITGVGFYNDEIWKNSVTSGWELVSYFVTDRCRHSTAFVDEVLYTCGGAVKSNEFALTDSVETCNIVTKRCTVVGKLVHAVESSANCVPFRGSLYIFGGLDKDGNIVSHVQKYDTEQNICTLLSKPMPRSYKLMRATLWETSVILLGCDTCFIYNFETETWEERKQFKTDVVHFGLVAENERLFVIGGGIWENDKSGNKKVKCRDDVRYVHVRNIVDDKPIGWKIHAKLSTPSLVHTYAKILFPA